MRYAYRNAGANLLDWNQSAAPRQSRPASIALGSLGGNTLAGTTLGGGSSLAHPTLVLPAPGAPEPILGGMGGCSCSGSCGCGPSSGMSGIADAVPGGYITLGVAAFLAWKFLGKRKRR
jgi:hypothetical protein